VNPEMAGMSRPPAAPASPSGPVTPPPAKAHPPTEAAAATPTPDSGAKPARKARTKSPVSDAAKRGLPAVQSAEYPEPDGPAPAPSIDKQVRPLSDRERAEAEFRRGMLALQGGNDTEGEDRLRAALAIDPLADKARQALLGLYVQRGRREDAERLLEDRLRLDRRHAGFAMALARLQLERGANGEALVSLQRTLPYGESNVDYQGMLATTLARVGRHKEAAERYEAATRLAPRNPLWLMGMGVELRADNRPEEARAAFQRAKDVGGLDGQLASFVDQQIKELK
jgi:MSHA biogenesis protein MshN